MFLKQEGKNILRQKFFMQGQYQYLSVLKIDIDDCDGLNTGFQESLSKIDLCQIVCNFHKDYYQTDLKDI